MAHRLLTPQEVDQFIGCLAAENPTPKSELNYTNHFTLLVAVVLSAQATDKGVNKATEHLFKVVSTAQDIVEMGEERLKDSIKTIGLFNTKAKNIVALSKILCAQYEGQVPQTRESLMKLPGVGRKTANVILNVAFHQPTLAVDTHIFRVANRVGLVEAPDTDKTELALMKVIPKKWMQHVHHWLILHGRYICKARKPLCPKCPVASLCQYENKTV